MTLTVTLSILGIIFIALGCFTIRNKRYGPEEGLRGTYIRGASAVVIGIIHVLLGLVLLGFVLIPR